MTDTTFQNVQRAIGTRRGAFATHPLLLRLEGPGTVDQARLIAQSVGFFVLGFQDVIRLISSSISKPELAELARANEAGDKGHDRWFLQDMLHLGVQIDVDWLFSKAHQVTRDVTYSQISSILHSRHDESRFALALVLEATGAEFFERMVTFLERMGRSEGLKFFGRYHQQVEEAHEIFQSEAQERLNSIPIPSEAQPEVWAIIERTFAGVETMASDIEAALVLAESK
jgi:hypothetical protein